jgi:hypothetical protein
MNFIWPNANLQERKLLSGIKILLGNDARLLAFLLDPHSPRLRKRAGILKEDAWNFSHGEQLLVRAALDFWSGSGHLQLWEMIETWDQTNWIHFLRAIRELRLDHQPDSSHGLRS